MDDAPTAAGTVNGRRFEWIADADSRLGPMLEVIINGRYGWLPMASIAPASSSTRRPTCAT